MKPDPAAAVSPIMTVKELAEYLHCHLSTVYRLIHQREIPVFKIGSDHRFNREKIAKWIAGKERSQDRSK